MVFANSGQEGLEVLQSNPDIELVISDMRMPKMDGIEFIDQVKRRNNALPCFILTGFNRTPEIDRAIEEKLVEDYFAKPIDRDVILQVIDAFLNRKKDS
jgi:CheY-like chemotaxis protein